MAAYGTIEAIEGQTLNETHSERKNYHSSRLVVVFVVGLMIGVVGTLALTTLLDPATTKSTELYGECSNPDPEGSSDCPTIDCAHPWECWEKCQAYCQECHCGPCNGLRNLIAIKLQCLQRQGLEVARPTTSVHTTPTTPICSYLNRRASLVLFRRAGRAAP